MLKNSFYFELFSVTQCAFVGSGGENKFNLSNKLCSRFRLKHFKAKTVSGWVFVHGVHIYDCLRFVFRLQTLVYYCLQTKIY